MGVLFFFIDGFGLGEKNKKNPLYRYGLWQYLITLNGLTLKNKMQSKKFAIIPTDTHLGLNGTPQSATGQTALFTGINAPGIIGGHLTGFPGETLTKIIYESSILKKLKEKGYQVTSANAYSRQYFQEVNAGKRYVSASTRAIEAAGIPFRMMEDLKKGNAVFMDITHHILKIRFPFFKMITPGHAARNLIHIMKEYNFVLYEYFWTDMLGHKGKHKDQRYILKVLNNFLKTLVKKSNLKKNTIIISSDHGNFEDEKEKGHTNNKVPTIVFSQNKGILNFFYHRITDLTTVPIAIMEGFDKGFWDN